MAIWKIIHYPLSHFSYLFIILNSLPACTLSTPIAPPSQNLDLVELPSSSPPIIANFGALFYYLPCSQNLDLVELPNPSPPIIANFGALFYCLPCSQNLDLVELPKLLSPYHCKLWGTLLLPSLFTKLRSR